MRRERIVRVIIIIVSLYLIVTTVQGTIGLLSAGEKVTRREKALAALLKQKEELVRKTKEAESKEYLEKVGYDELGMARPGEQIVIIPKELLQTEKEKALVPEEPNWKKWLALLVN